MYYTKVIIIVGLIDQTHFPKMPVNTIIQGIDPFTFFVGHLERKKSRRNISKPTTQRSQMQLAWENNPRALADLDMPGNSCKIKLWQGLDPVQHPFLQIWKNISQHQSSCEKLEDMKIGRIYPEIFVTLENKTYSGWPWPWQISTSKASIHLSEDIEKI